MTDNNQLKGTHVVEIENNAGDSVEYKLIMIPEKAKRTTLAVHGAESEADEFVAAADQAKKAEAAQKGKKESLINLTKVIRNQAVAGGVSVPETVRFSTHNGRSVTSTAKYTSVTIDNDMYTNLRSVLGSDDLETIVTEDVSLKIELKGKNPKLLARKCAKALEGIVECEEKIAYKTNSGIEVYQYIEELLEGSGKDIERVEALTELRKVMQPGFSVAVSTRIATPVE